MHHEVGHKFRVLREGEMTSDPPPILTIGHRTTRSIGSWNCCDGAGVEAVADVRTRPVSRFCRNTTRPRWRKLLRAAGISMSSSAGAWRTAVRSALYRDAVADFERMAESAAFADGLEH